MRSALLLCVALLSLSTVAAAALPPAPMDQATGLKIAAIVNQMEEPLEAELSAAQGDSEATAEVIGRYANAAFEHAGYSHDETLYQYLTAKTGNPLQMNLFAREVGFGFIVQTVVGQMPGYADGFLRSGAVSQRTVNALMQDDKPSTSDKEISLPVVAGWQYPADPFVRENRIAMSLSSFEGEGEWANYVIFRTYNPDDFYIFGARTDLDPETLSVLDKVRQADASATVEAHTRCYQGQGQGNFKVCYVDRSNPVKLTLEKPVSAYR